MYWIIQTTVVAIVLLSALFGISSTAHDVIVSVDSSHSIANPGENVTLTCRLTGHDHVHSSVQWLKQVSGSGAEVISRDTELSALYRLLLRYEVDLVVIGDVIIYILNIYLVRPEDSGRISCSVPQIIHPESVSLHVFKPPERISFLDYPSDGVLVLDEHATVPTIKCRTARALPPPHFAFHIGPRSLGQHFITNSTLVVHCPPLQGSDRALGFDRPLSIPGGLIEKTCPVHLDYDTVASLSGYQVTHKDDGQFLTCTAIQRGHGWTQRSEVIPSIARLRLSVKYAPRFNCSKHVEAEPGANDFIILCDVFYNPRPTHISVRWRDKNRNKNAQDGGENEQESVIHVGEALEGVSLQEQLIDVEGRRHSRLTLRIDYVMSKHFTSYHIHVKNSLGEKTHTTHLIEKKIIKQEYKAPSSSLGRMQRMQLPVSCSHKLYLNISTVTAALVVLYLVNISYRLYRSPVIVR